MSTKLIVAIVAVAGLLFLGTAVYAHGPGMGWGYDNQMSSGFGWGHHMGYNGYGHHMGYGYQQNNGVCYQQGQTDSTYYGPQRGPGYHRGQMPNGWNNNESW